MKIIKVIKTIGFVLSFCAVLCACQEKPKPSYVENPLLQNLPIQQQQLLQKIAASRIVVIKEGMLFTFVIPTDCFFNREHRELKESQKQYLLLLAQFINEYSSYFKTFQVSVTGYTDKVWLYPARQKLSKLYAEDIAAALREGNVTVPMTVRGAGAKDPIASNRYPNGTVYNRRVVVKLR